MTTTPCANCPKSQGNFYNQAISHVAIVAHLYSAFVLDKATVGCFLLLQLMAELLRDNINPLIDLLSEILLA